MNEEVMLLLHGVTRWCADCATPTVFVPALEDAKDDPECYCCTVCDAAVCWSEAA